MSLDVGVNYLYENENNEIPYEFQIYQDFKVNLTTEIDVEAGIYIPIGIGDMHIAFGLRGILSKFSSETYIKINCLNNTYFIGLKGSKSSGFGYYLKVGMNLRLLLINIGFDYYIFDELINEKPITINIIFKEYPFEDSILEKKSFKKISLFSYSDIDFEHIQQLLERILH